jgi:hypothetical protein
VPSRDAVLNRYDDVMVKPFIMTFTSVHQQQFK